MVFTRSGSATGLSGGGALAREVAMLPEHKEDDSDDDD